MLLMIPVERELATAYWEEAYHYLVNSHYQEAFLDDAYGGGRYHN